MHFVLPGMQHCLQVALVYMILPRYETEVLYQNFRQRISSRLVTLL